ncbi:MAG TPA: hypothetical protein VKA85_08270 [Candidatus Limnocylindrales bacterium]|nr:hypothetical protein [Candidatus Limnocylindrales bacterium]
MTDTAAERLRTERRRLDALGVSLRTVAVGYATVDLDEAEAQLRLTLGARGVRAGADDALLGARTRIVETTDGALLVLLEPCTEGRLAASLARFGHGAVVEYLEVADEGTDVAAAAALAGIRLSAPAHGPFGPSRLVVGGRAWGPHVVLVDRPGAATIES